MIVVSATKKMLALYKGKLQSIDRQILLKSDFLVNADEGGSSRAAIEAFRTNVFRTAAGLKLLDSIYLR